MLSRVNIESDLLETRRQKAPNMRQLWPTVEPSLASEHSRTPSPNDKTDTVEWADISGQSGQLDGTEYAQAQSVQLISLSNAERPDTFNDPILEDLLARRAALIQHLRSSKY